MSKSMNLAELSLIARYDEGLDVRIEMAQALKTFSKVFEEAARSDVFQEAQRRRWLLILEEASALII